MATLRKSRFSTCGSLIFWSISGILAHFFLLFPHISEQKSTKIGNKAISVDFRPILMIFVPNCNNLGMKNTFPVSLARKLHYLTVKTPMSVCLFRRTHCEGPFKIGAYLRNKFDLVAALGAVNKKILIQSRGRGSRNCDYI